MVGTLVTQNTRSIIKLKGKITSEERLEKKKFLMKRWEVTVKIFNLCLRLTFSCFLWISEFELYVVDLNKKKKCGTVHMYESSKDSSWKSEV